MGNVFPETMNHLDYGNVKDCIKTIEDYIRYICERTDFSVTNVTRKAAAAGNSNAEVLVELEEIRGDISRISNLANAASAKANSNEASINEINNITIPNLRGEIKEVSDEFGPDGRIPVLEQKTANLIAEFTDETGDIPKLYKLYADLDKRVSALEV